MATTAQNWQNQKLTSDLWPSGMGETGSTSHSAYTCVTSHWWDFHRHVTADMYRAAAKGPYSQRREGLSSRVVQRGLKNLHFAHLVDGIQ